MCHLALLKHGSMPPGLVTEQKVCCEHLVSCQSKLSAACLAAIARCEHDKHGDIVMTKEKEKQLTP